MSLGASRLAPSDRRGFWEAVFTGADRPAEGTQAADAPWLVDRLTGVDAEEGRQRMLALCFAQRVFEDAPASALPEVVRAMRGFRSFPALALTLERLGVNDPALHAEAAARARRLSREQDASHPLGLAQFQGALALLDRARRMGALTPAEARELVRSLLAGSDREDAHGADVAAWLKTTALPLLAARTGSTPDASAEEVAIRALAGARPTDPLPEVHWEGLLYRVDLATAEAARIGAVRQAQGPPTLDEALDSFSPAPSRRAGPAQRVLAEALTALVYAADLPAPQAGVSEHGARRHEFGAAWAARPSDASPAWSLPQEVWGAGLRWHVRGALLDLDVALARHRLSRADALPPPATPRLDPAERQAFAEAAALVEPAALEDAARDALVAALERGRARVARASVDAGARARLAADLGGSHSEPLLEWAVRRGPQAWNDLFTLGDLLRVGWADLDALDAWGLPALRHAARLTLRLPPRPFHERALAGRPHVGALGECVADLNLRIAEALSEKALPARLAGPLLQRAAQDLADEVGPAYAEDARAIALFARDLPSHRIDDYVSALVGSVLVPVTE